MFQTDVDVTVAIPNGDLWKVNGGDQGHLDYVLGQLKKHERIIKLVFYSFNIYKTVPTKSF